MAPVPCAKYSYVLTSTGPKIIPVDQPVSKDEESPADYNTGGYLPVKLDDTFKKGRYRVVRKLGWGHFSTVWLVKDAQTGGHSALKVVKSAGRYAETARDEIKLLSQVASVSPNHRGRAHIVSFLDSFSHQGPESSHICIVFEPLGENLLALIERNKKKGVPKALVKIIARQVLLGLQYLHDECDLVHTDIKPENILISIPDIENHINQELSQSPVPTSRRVGVPQPNKSRTGVTIPYNSTRSRRQVQIFDSQPLSSPGRSLGRSSNGAHTSIKPVASRPSGSASQSNSYVTQMNLLRNSSSAVTFISAAPSGSSIPKISSNLATSIPARDLVKVTHPTPRPPHDFKPQSTVSSSSSISSAVASTLAGSSSIITTPSTSLSQSMTLANPPAGFTHARSFLEAKHKHEDSYRIEVKAPEDFVGLSTSPSWIEHKSKGNTLKSTKTRSAPRHGHSHSQSSVSSARWQDPGAAQPAPAVLVNTIVNAEAQPPSAPIPLPSSSPNSIALSTSKSESLSNSGTATQPSPAGTPLGSRKTKTMSIINGVSKLISDTSNIFSSSLTSGDELKPSSPLKGDTNIMTSHVSLLTQTAPARIVPVAASPPVERSSLTRPSPPQHISQLSAHMHSGPCPTSTSQASTMLGNLSLGSRQDGGSNSASRRRNAPPAASIDTRTAAAGPSSPAPPPPTPIDGPHFGSHVTHYESYSSPFSPSNLDVDNLPPISIKIADLGNATPSKKHYTEDIQTRQYRSPEAIVGRKDWDTRADIWSVACVVFELLTAEYLFDPQGQGELFTKDDDHMAQIIELLGDFDLEVKMGGKYSRELFDHAGALRYIKTLKPWPLKRVMTEKYLYTEEDANALTAFLLPMLKTDMRKRAHARDLIHHPWLNLSDDDEIPDW